ncbi:MAG: DUF4174 domain-containing protein [Rhodobacteraceae bacterium]|nr:DUF4174 domain-containing protein [Paracoccaceae bacterium]
MPTPQRLVLTFLAAALIITPATAQELSEYLWKNRPLVIFADTPLDPHFIRQMELLSQDTEELEERDVVILTDSDPAANSALRETLRPRGFMLALLGKDGKVKLRKPRPWTVRELSRAIDKFPLRIDELRQKRER